MKNNLSFLALILMIFTISSEAQTIHIKGKITTSSGEAVPGANIYCKNMTQTAVSDVNGLFSISCRSGKDTLIISFVGFITEVIPVGIKTYLEVQLKDDIKSLDEIVVIGYGSVKKKDITAAVAGISVEHFSESRDVPLQTVVRHSAANTISGILTAGELNDFCKWKLWKDISNNELKEFQKTWEFAPLERYTVQFQTENGKPVTDAVVKLFKDTVVIWVARTDNTGKAELWANAFSTAKTEKIKYSIDIIYMGQTYKINKASDFHKGINIINAPVACEFPDNVDIAFVVDATGSMQDEIDYLKAELSDIISRIKDTLPGLNINLASVFYRDEGDEYITRLSDFSEDITQTVNFIKANMADGGGDTPEAVDQALKTTLDNLSWSEKALCRIAFLILDAPPHETESIKESLKILIKSYAAKGIKIIPITCSGIDKGTEYLMRSFSLFTNGTYLFLTDHSGVGGKHIKPTTDTYDVELLNKLLQKVILQNVYTPGCVDKVETIAADTVNVRYTASVADILPDSTLQASSNSESKAAVEKTGSEQSFKIYPNPTHGNITIELNGEFGDLYITDLTGKILERVHTSDRKSVETNINKYPTGIYLIRYEYKPDKWLTGKVILLH